MGDRKRKHASVSPGNEETIDPADELMFLCLGGGNEVGRSCHIIQYKGKTVMVRATQIVDCLALRIICTDYRTEFTQL